MNLSQLAYLDAVARCGSLTEAARELCVTQQAVSSGLSALERELGVRLFERTPGSVQPTAAGQETLSEARAALDAVARMRSRTARLRDDVRGTVSFAYATCTVGTSEGRHPNQSDLAAFTASKPNMTLRLFEAASDACLALVSRQTADIALVAGRPDDTVYGGVFLCDPELVLCVPAAHPFAARDGKLSYAELHGIAQFLPPDLNYSLRATDAACRAWGFEPHYTEMPPGETDQIGLVAAGQGVAFMPEGYEPALADMRVRLVHMRPKEACRVPLWLAWRTGEALGPAARALVDFLQGMFAQRESQASAQTRPTGTPRPI